MVVIVYNRPLLVVNRVLVLEWHRGVGDIAVLLVVVNNMLGDNSKRQQRLDCNNQLLV